ncbi:L,D-transpeptidase family protein [Sulfurospirillum halorespirans]|uniref:Transpeptidase domain-containing protein n=1 Tax=Sulfurospirillum halorespirans DSM 13726 TaxID=1193502 RepID=A0A1D7TNF0_9BACT|nr:L,D-transpeptidase family protein [Sulfurospirillum halorespirans]AOO66526.1 transpeptidase domain-containing protein [Sulfurospirillum halorespirans DSM 13726]
MEYYEISIYNVDAYLSSLSLFSMEKADIVIVSKKEKTMILYKDKQDIGTYPVVFGANNLSGHKQQEGDKRTPEGFYTLDYKKQDSAFHKAIHISYPNAKDIETAHKLGVSPGSAIMIHGQKNGFGWASFIMQFFNWTNGCISDMDLIWNAIDAGTPIEIRP